MANPILTEAQSKMDGALHALSQQLDGLRTGKASPALVENITALYYGAPTRIRELGNIATPEPRLITITPYDPSVAGEIVKSILAANIGVTPVSDGRKIRVPIPELSEEKCRAYRPSRRASAGEQASFADLFEAGRVEMDDLLVSANPMYPGRATVTSRGKIMLANGEMFDDPTEAYERFLTSLGASVSGLNGWMYWRRGEGGPLLDTLREGL